MDENATTTTETEDPSESGEASEVEKLKADIVALKEAISKERALTRAAEKKLKAYGDLDPDEARAALERIAELGSGEPDDKAKEQIEALRKQLGDRYDKDVGERDKTIAALHTDIERLVVDAAATAALAKHKADADLLLPHVKAAVKVERDDSGRPVARVYEGDAELISMESGSTKPMSLDEYVGTKLKERFPAGFPGSGASGSGATGSTGTGGGAGQFTISEAEARENPRAFQAKYEAAQKAGAELRVVG